MTTKTKSITPGQKKQVARLMEAALARINLDPASAQRLIENGDQFQSRIRASIRKLSVNNQFAAEAVDSEYCYPSGYQPKGIADQIACLREMFPQLGTADTELPHRELLPPGAEGWFAIPRWERIAPQYNPSYNAALDKVLALFRLIIKGRFTNSCEDKTQDYRLRQHKRTEAMFRKLGDKQEGHDILIVPAQFGLRHRGRSSRRAREMFKSNEFGLGAFAVGIMLLTHLERLEGRTILGIHCAGDCYARDRVHNDVPFSSVPSFLGSRYYEDPSKFQFTAIYLDVTHDWLGAASAFIL